MKLHELRPAKGSRHSRKRVGRGPGSGLGKTAGRGHKGQKSRSGYSRRVGFEGGQLPLVRRLPKRGFTSLQREEYSTVNVDALAELRGTVSPTELLEHGLVRKGRKVKILGNGEITRALTVRAHKFTATARKKLEAAGGRCEELP